MADTTSFDQIVVLSAGAPQPAPVKARRKSSRLGKVASAVAWLGLMTVGIGAIVPLSLYTLDEINNRLLLQADQAGIEDTLEQDWSHSTSPDYVETVSELAMQLPVVDTGSAYVAASRATELDASRAFAWAQLAYLETRRASGKVNEASLNALTRSMDACPLCSQELVAWRFNFVLTNWYHIPDPLRRRAFEQADMLRWVGQNAEFLAEMRLKARKDGIPFDIYREAVNTPARTWDIDASAVAQAELKAQPAQQVEPEQPATPG
ncbi:MAG: hypothetical protein EOP61_16515 [Sphingomonadales bacterium]|nr:MAG: hypothetical protein EOP61_16515 [Sphingomonadales bacterium]